MNRLEKKQEILNIKSMIEDHSSIMVIHYQGLNVTAINALRGEIRSSGSKIKVVKNSLAKLAIENTSTGCIEGFLSGPTALVASNDPALLAKKITDFAKENKSLLVLGGVVENQLVNAEGVISLSQLPSKDELRAKIIGLLNAPATKLVRVISTPAQQLARVVSAYSEK